MAEGVWLETLTWVEAKAWFDGGAPVLVPIGAISKEHGHHLPLNTDWLVARELTKRVLAELPIVAAPVVDFGFYPAFVRYPGSQHLQSATFEAVLRDILTKFVADGVRNLAILNTGVSTEPVVQLAARNLLNETGSRVHVADIRNLGHGERAILDQKLGGHGDESETSMIMAIDRDVVRFEKAVPDYGNMLGQPETVFRAPSTFDGDPNSGVDYSITGVRGDPTLATVEKGERILSAMAADLIDGLRAIFPDALGS